MSLNLLLRRVEAMQIQLEVQLQTSHEMLDASRWLLNQHRRRRVEMLLAEEETETLLEAQWKALNAMRRRLSALRAQLSGDAGQ